LASAEDFDTALWQAQTEVAEGKYVWPYHIAYGQRV
jgi:hypothetical protein